jgi:hypothetical protein
MMSLDWASVMTGYNIVYFLVIRGVGTCTDAGW